MGKNWGLWSLLLALVAFPFFLQSYSIQILSEIYLFAIFAMSLDLMLGYTGLPSLGHGAFFGLGAYSAAILTVRVGTSFSVTVALALLAVLLGSLVVGSFCVKASGITFLMLTLAFSQMFYAVAHRWTSLTGGSDGLTGVLRPVAELKGVVLDFSDSRLFYYLCFLLALVVFAFLRCIVRSPFGAVLVGIRENEARMRSVGFPVRRFQLCSFILSSLLAGLGGAFYAFFNGFVSPEELYWPASAMVLVMLVLGGAGTVIGPALGAAFVLIVQDLVSSTSERWPMVVGGVFVLFVILVRDGLIGLARRSMRRFGWER
jgi:branched-chain amino acid transport system permease protein